MKKGATKKANKTSPSKPKAPTPAAYHQTQVMMTAPDYYTLLRDQTFLTTAPQDVINKAKLIQERTIDFIRIASEHNIVSREQAVRLFKEEVSKDKSIVEAMEGNILAELARFPVPYNVFAKQDSGVPTVEKKDLKMREALLLESYAHANVLHAFLTHFNPQSERREEYLNRMFKEVSQASLYYVRQFLEAQLSPNTYLSACRTLFEKCNWLTTYAPEYEALILKKLSENQKEENEYWYHGLVLLEYYKSCIITLSCLKLDERAAELDRKASKFVACLDLLCGNHQHKSANNLKSMLNAFGKVETHTDSIMIFYRQLDNLMQNPDKHATQEKVTTSNILQKECADTELKFSQLVKGQSKSTEIVPLFDNILLHLNDYHALPKDLRDEAVIKSINAVILQGLVVLKTPEYFKQDYLILVLQEMFKVLEEEFDQALKMQSEIARNAVEIEMLRAKIAGLKIEQPKPEQDERMEALQRQIITALRLDHEQRRERQRAELEESSRALNEQRAKEHTQELENLKQEFAAALLLEKGTFLSKQSHHRETLEAKFERKKRDLTRQHSAQIEKLAQEHESLVAACDEEFLGKESAFMKVLETELSDKQRQHAAALRKLQQDHRTSLTERKQALSEENRPKVEALTKEHEAEIAGLKKKHEMALSNVKREIQDELEALRKTYQTKVLEHRKCLQEQFQQLEKQQQADLDAHAEQFALETKQYIDRANEQYQDAVRLLKEKYAQIKQTQKQALTSQRVQVLQEHETSSKISLAMMENSLKTKLAIEDHQPLTQIFVCGELQYLLDDLEGLECYLWGRGVGDRLLGRAMLDQRIDVIINSTVEQLPPKLRKRCQTYVQNPEVLSLGNIVFRCAPWKDLKEVLLAQDLTLDTFICTSQGDVYDLLGVRADLQQQCLKVTGNAEKRFQDDPRLMLDLICQYNQTRIPLAQVDVTALQKHADCIKKLSIVDYLRYLQQLFTGPQYIDNYKIICQMGILHQVCPMLPADCRQGLSKEFLLLNQFWLEKMRQFSDPQYQFTRFHVLSLLMMMPLLLKPKEQADLQAYLKRCIEIFFLKYGKGVTEEEKPLIFKMVESIILAPQNPELGLYAQYCNFVKAAKLEQLAQQAQLAQLAQQVQQVQQANAPVVQLVDAQNQGYMPQYQGANPQNPPGQQVQRHVALGAGQPKKILRREQKK